MKRRIVIIKDENSYRQFRLTFIIEAITLLTLAFVGGIATAVSFFIN